MHATLKGFLIATALLMTGPQPTNAAGQPMARAAADQGVFDASVGLPDAGDRIPVFYAAPGRITARTRVVFVMHGNRRDAGHYRDIWTPYARDCGVVVVAPEFSQQQFPGYWHYQMGNAYTAGGDRVPPGQTDYAIIERIFDAVRRKFHLVARTYDIFGHSAGAQFVHRMIVLGARNRIGIAIAANAGTYTVPDETASLPFGLKGMTLHRRALSRAFATRLWVLVGGDDTNPNSRVLNRSAGAMAQGANRFQRAHYFFRAAKEAAHRARLPFDWKFQVVPHVGHSAKGMSAAAARILGCR